MDIVSEILAHIERSGLSDRAVSLAATNHDTAVRDLRRAKGATLKTLLALCDVLDLELFVRPIGVGALDANPPPLSPRLLAALLLPADATEADALARIAGWPDTAHQIMARRHALDARARALADRLEAALAPLLADLRAGLDAPMLGDDPKE